MTPTIEQIKEILAGAPDGATHCTDTVPSMNLYAKVEHLGGFYVSLSNRWESYPIYAGIHLLSDLVEILTLRQRVQELETQVRSIALSRDELAATVERLRGVVVNYHDENIAAEEAINELWDIHKATPATNLNHVKRSVFADGYYEGFSDARDSNHDRQQDHINYGLERSEIEAEKQYPSVKDGA